MTSITHDFAEPSMFGDTISRAATIEYLRKHMAETARRMGEDGLHDGAVHALADLDHAIRLIETMPAMEITNV
jgi:hypothetical protein